METRATSYSAKREICKPDAEQADHSGKHPKPVFPARFGANAEKCNQNDGTCKRTYQHNVEKSGLQKAKTQKLGME